MNMSAPLFLYSYLPAMKKYKVLSKSKSQQPWKWPLTKSLIRSFFCACRFWNSWTAWNFTTLSPLGRMPSGFRFSRYSASTAVICETVVNTSAECAAARSMQ